MFTQLSCKSTVKRSSRLNPTLKKKLGFQKLEIEFIPKARKRARSDSKASPILFDSPDDPSQTSQEVNQAELDVTFTNGGQWQEVNSQNITPSTYEFSQFADSVPQNASAVDIGKLVNGSLDSQEFDDEIRKLANEGLNSQDFAAGTKTLANEGLHAQDLVNVIDRFAIDGQNSEDFADAIKKLANDGLTSEDVTDVIETFPDCLYSQNFAEEVGKPPNELCPLDLANEIEILVHGGVDSQDLADEITKYLDPGPSAQHFAAPCAPNVESAKAKLQTTLNSKPVRNQAPSIDGNILPESFRKAIARASRSAAQGNVTQKIRRSRNKIELASPSEMNAAFEPAKSLQPVSQLKKPRAGIVAKPAKRKTGNTFPHISSLVEPLQIEVISQQTKPSEMNVSFEPAKNLQPTAKKRGRKPRAITASKSATRKSQSTFPDMNSFLQPLNVDVVSQETVPCEVDIPFEPVKNLQPTGKRRRRKRRTLTGSKSAKRKPRSTFPDMNSFLQPLNIEVFSQKTVPCEIDIPFEPAMTLQPNSEKKGRKPRISSAVKPAERKFDFNSSLEPQKTETASKTRSYSSKPKPEFLTEKSVIRRTRLSDKKQAALESAEVELCSLFSSWSVKSGEEAATCVAPRSEVFTPRQPSNVSTPVFFNLSLSDMYNKETVSADADDLSDLTDLFTMELNVGNFSESLNVMSVLRQVTKIQKKLPHFVPPSENWFEGFEIW